MHTFNNNSAHDVWLNAAKVLHNEAQEQKSRNFKDANNPTETLEIMPVAMTIQNPCNRVVFARPINPAFAIVEVIWILAGGNSLKFLEFWNPRMKTWSDDNHSMHGAYGWRLGSSASSKLKDYQALSINAGTGFDQLKAAYEVLKLKPYQRQIILQIWDANYDFPNVYDGSPRSKDIPCNIFADLKVRNNKLHWHQYMRSNDLIWGTPYNFIQWTSIHEIVAGWLGLETGPYTHIVTSLHVYEHHYDELEKIVNSDNVKVPTNSSSLHIEGYENWLQVFSVVLDAAIGLIESETKEELDRIFNENMFMISDNDFRGYREWCWVLYYEALRRKGWLEDDPLKWKKARNDMGEYWWESWYIWWQSQVSKLLHA